jgi:hypothetical protein
MACLSGGSIGWYIHPIRVCILDMYCGAYYMCRDGVEMCIDTYHPMHETSRWTTPLVPLHGGYVVVYLHHIPSIQACMVLGPYIRECVHVI